MAETLEWSVKAMLHSMSYSDPDFFDSSWLTKVKTDVGSNWRLKVSLCAQSSNIVIPCGSLRWMSTSFFQTFQFSNLKKILKSIIDYYNEVCWLTLCGNYGARYCKRKRKRRPLEAVLGENHFSFRYCSSKSQSSVFLTSVPSRSGEAETKWDASCN